MPRKATAKVILFGILGPLFCGAEDASAQETLFACYVPATGTVYRIRATGLHDACQGPKSGQNMHVEFSWNAQGSTGPEGPPGPPALTGLEVVTATSPFDNQTLTKAISVDCPSGKVPIGGGASAQGSDSFIKASNPTASGWTATAVGNSNFSVTAYGICAITG